MKKILLTLILCGIPISAMASANTEPYPGYTLFVPLDGGSAQEPEDVEDKIYLFDLNNELVHSWNVSLTDGRFAFLNPDGTLALRENTVSQADRSNEANPASLKEIGWDGSTLWEWENSYFHHDMARLPNGNYLVILWEIMSNENKAQIPHCKKTGDFWTDKIVEVDRDTGAIIYEWHLQEELNISEYTIDCRESRVEWTHVNAVEYLPEGNPFNGEASFMISSKTLNKVFIVNLKSGKVEWESPDGMFHGQHDPTLLDNGNILVFNNLYEEKASQVVEINPQTNEIVWTYERKGFFSNNISGAQRLDNGNTLITEGSKGNIFEISSDSEIVWEYNYRSVGGSNSIFRAYRYGLDQFDWPFIEPIEASEPLPTTDRLPREWNLYIIFSSILGAGLLVVLLYQRARTFV